MKRPPGARAPLIIVVLFPSFLLLLLLLLQQATATSATTVMAYHFASRTMRNTLLCRPQSRLARPPRSQLLPSFGHCRGYRATPICGLQINIHIRGKRTGGEEWLNEGYQEYTKRLRPVLALDTIWHKTDAELEAAVFKEKGSVICLDERGKQMTSMEMADVLYKKMEEGGSRMAIVIGGAEGLPSALKKNKELWSLSRLTFTHQWARVLLAEQIYRATEIKKGSGYHKE